MKNTAKFQLNHFFKNTPSSVFNQFKHFLALSLLITFSFNAFSVDDSQQFNKEAYLDLSKPYKQKNPQSATKKDNQATTILKEVAGTARTALGSTNSGNTDQLGNKITKGVSNQLKNKAINKTEGFVNNKANTFLNAFGAGRSEVSIGGLSSKKLNYSLRTIQPISELDANSKALTFIQASIASGKSIDSRRTTVNLGIGHRLLVEDDMAIAGINVFTDYESKSSHKRL
ncbi:inverse autotransporter beta domain-containing protein, partial [bacterium endosymbiont of Bathymodiolus sp. 5 South]|uniref:inverse autotransporter beta domain-containing protein n=1 Tax=bacterium endosymbiont of Bathymodiolus sp. 5 South TaxID=1181670 RepID=UPI0015D59E3D